MSQMSDKKKCSESDNESDVSTVSSLSNHKSILKSPFNRGARRKKRSVSFSLDADVHFSSDNESECSRNTNILSLLNMVDGSIRGDEGAREDIRGFNDRQQPRHAVQQSDVSDHSYKRSQHIDVATNAESEPKNVEKSNTFLDQITACDELLSGNLTSNNDAISIDPQKFRKRKHSDSPKD